MYTEQADKQRRIVGILLAAGKGSRFDPAGVQNKLMQTLPDGRSVAVAAAQSILGELTEVVAVVRDASSPLAIALRDTGCTIVACADAEHGMSASLKCGLLAAADADGWLIALADMPALQTGTVAALVRAIREGAGIAAPCTDGVRGNPVAFARSYREALLQLSGDRGARRLLKDGAVTLIEVDDPGIFHDIDTRADLAR